MCVSRVCALTDLRAHDGGRVLERVIAHALEQVARKLAPLGRKTWLITVRACVHAYARGMHWDYRMPGVRTEQGKMQFRP